MVPRLHFGLGYSNLPLANSHHPTFAENFPLQRSTTGCCIQFMKINKLSSAKQNPLSPQGQVACCSLEGRYRLLVLPLGLR